MSTLSRCSVCRSDSVCAYAVPEMPRYICMCNRCKSRWAIDALTDEEIFDD